MTKLLSDEQQRRDLFCKMTGRVATIDTQSYFAFCKGIESAVLDAQKQEPVDDPVGPHAEE